MDYTRRDFLNTITTATLGAVGLSVLPGNAKSKGRDEPNFNAIPENGTVLFQGDSITDFSRDRKENNPNSGLGNGYAFIAAAALRDTLPKRHVKCYNRGISGNKVFQLADRWQDDCLALKPDLLSILVGVNDFWHTLARDYDGNVEVYERDYRKLLKRTKKALPDVKLILGEPYVVREGTAINENWFPTFPKYQAAAQQIAQDFNAALIPYQHIYDEAAKRSDQPTYWTEDGVHPSLAGCHLMARAWLETAKRV